MHTWAASSRRPVSTPVVCATTAWRRWCRTARELGLLEAVAYNQVECFEAGVLFARNEGIVPAPESNHAIKGAIEEALRCKREGKAETILFCLSGHGHFDMASYQKFFAGEAVGRKLQRE